MTFDSFETIWGKVLNKIKIDIGESLFKVWFSNLTPKNFSHGILKIEVPSKFVKDWLEKKFNSLFLKSVKEFIPEVKNIEFIVSNKPLKENKNYFKKINKNIIEKPISLFEINPQTNLNPRYRFNNFVVGPSNELAFAACEAVVKSPNKIYNPLFIYGPVGVGKTHLLQAIGNESYSLNKNLKIKYSTTEEFTNEFINALKNHSVNEFRYKFRDVDILILDDVHFLSGKNSSQEELFHTFNYLYNLSKQIVFSSDRPPQLIPDIEERLKSRFEGGLVVDIQPPDFETKIAILKLKSQEKGVIFDNEIYELIAKKTKDNIRELEGILNSVIFNYFKNNRISKEKVEEIVKKFSKDYYKKISPKKVIKVVTEYYQIKEDDIFKKTRIKHLVEIRQFLIYFLREISQLSYPSIGHFLKKDHTTVIYSYEKIVEKMKKDPNFCQEINNLKSKILES